MTKRILSLFFFLCVVPTVLFSLRGWSLPGGDSDWMATLVTRPLYFFLRAPLVVAFHKSLWLLLRGWGWEPADCIALSSSIAGGVFLAGLFRLCRNPRVWAVVLLSKFSLVFLGHIENYAWPYALSLWCVVFLKETVEEGKPTWSLWAVWVIAVFCHPMVLMLLPGLIWGLWPLDKRKGVEILVSLLFIAGLADFLMVFGKAGGLPQEKWILPVFSVGDSLANYAFFSWQHWKEVLGFHIQTMPIGVFLLIRYGWREWFGWKGGLAAIAGTTLLWSLVWNPGMGAIDWDLFAWPALFINLAGGWAWSQGNCDKKKRRSESGPERRSD